MYMYMYVCYMYVGMCTLIIWCSFLLPPPHIHIFLPLPAHTYLLPPPAHIHIPSLPPSPLPCTHMSQDEMDPYEKLLSPLRKVTTRKQPSISSAEHMTLRSSSQSSKPHGLAPEGEGILTDQSDTQGEPEGEGSGGEKEGTVLVGFEMIMVIL